MPRRLTMQSSLPSAVVGRPVSVKSLLDSDGFEYYETRGSAIVYARNGSTWTEQAFLEADDGAEGDYFGADVDISGDVILVGATQQNLYDYVNNTIPPRRGKAVSTI